MRKIFFILLFIDFLYSYSYVQNSCTDFGVNYVSSGEETDSNICEALPTDSQATFYLKCPSHDAESIAEYKLYKKFQARNERNDEGDYRRFVLQTSIVVNCTAPTCTDAEELIEDTCEPKCSEGETRNDIGVCEASPTCNVGYDFFNSIDTPSSCSNYLDSDGKNHYEDIYRLFPNVEEEFFSCCAKGRSTPVGDAPTDTNETTPTDDTTPTPDTNTTDNGDDPNDSSDGNSGSDGSSGSSDGGSDTDGSSGSNTGTPTDSNSSTSSTTEAILAGIKSEMTNASTQAHADQVSNGEKYDGIIIGLRDVVATTTSIGEQAHTDAENALTNANTNAENSDAQNQDNADQNHDDLSDIKDALTDGEEEADADSDSVKKGFSDLKDSVFTGKESILSSLNALLTSYTKTPPVFVGSGTSYFSANVLNGSVVIDLAMFSNLKQYFDIIFTLMLAFINFKIYRWIFTILLSIGV